MDISEDILDKLRTVFAEQQFTTLNGTYDGESGEIVMVFPAKTYEQAFVYTGASVADFTSLLYDVVAAIIMQYNVDFGVTDREAFLEEVTE
jgi:hypothetical protein